jgi:hypothetical protein
LTIFFHNEMTEIDTDLSTYLANQQKRMTEALKTFTRKRVKGNKL